MQKRALLIVEDDEAIGANLVAAAEDVGASVVGPVESVSEALVRLDEGGIDGAVVDVRLQDRDVTPVVLRLVEKSVPFVIHSGYALPDQLAAMDLGRQIIMKPADPESVMNQVLDLIGNARSLAGSSDSTLSALIATLKTLDAQGESMAAIYVQSAIDVLVGSKTKAV